ncbi:hypothetical protein Tco_0684774, partial [Tanacetum coccineum]
ALIWGLSSAMGSKWIGIDPLTIYTVGAANIRVQWSASMPGHLYNLQMQIVTVGSGDSNHYGQLILSHHVWFIHYTSKSDLCWMPKENPACHDDDAVWTTWSHSLLVIAEPM